METDVNVKSSLVQMHQNYIAVVSLCNTDGPQDSTVTDDLILKDRNLKTNSSACFVIKMLE